MGPAFCIYSEESTFANSLSRELQPLGGVALLTETSAPVPQASSLVFVFPSFHGRIPATNGKPIIRIEFFKSPLQSLQKHTYYIHKDSDPQSVSAAIARVVKGFHVWKSWVFTPFPQEVDDKEHVQRVDRFTPVSVKPTPPPVLVQKQTAVRKEVTRPVRRSSPRVPRLKLSPVVPLAVVVVALWVFFIPLLLLAVSAGCSLFGMKSLMHLQFGSSDRFLRCTKATASLSIQIEQSFALVPQLRSVTATPLSVAQFLVNAGNTGQKSLAIIKALTASPSLETFALQAPALTQLSRELQTLVAQRDELSMAELVAPSVTQLLQKAPLVNVASALANRADSVLGQKKQVVYMVLLQNNMELRPTGGFIGSFVLVDVNSGKIVSYKTYDVYDADGQLQGYIKPPSPIVTYLGEASWHMRDSNWDPDFAVSAQRAAWFLEKSMDIKVDGVIGVNLEVLRTIISSLGPLSIPDYTDTLTSDNFYQTIQSQVHKEFFPGSRRKSNYLTAVLNSTITRLQDKGGEHTLSLFLSFASNTRARDIQFYSTDPVFQDALARAGVSGGVPPHAIGFIEANLGVNKANQFIERTGSVTATREGNELSVHSSLTITNKAREQGDETRYRVYLRSLAPTGGVLTELKAVVAGKEQAIIPEKDTIASGETAGAFIEVKAGERAVIDATWVLLPTNELVVWKQGGVASYPLRIKTLTGGSLRTYNTELAEDTPISL